MRNLREPMDSMVGREQELRELRRILRTTRLLTLVGPAGVGKTRLSTELARRLVRGRGQYLCVVELDAISDGTLLLQGVTEALGLGGEAARRDWTVLVEAIGEREILLVLDNCEHLLDTCSAAVESLLRRCPRLRVLATSRQPLTVAGELVFPVEVLPLPEPGTECGSTAPHPAAVQLFLDRARACDTAFRLTQDNAGVVAEICRRLDGLPLAIELAARRICALPPAEILSGLDNQLALLTDGSRAGPDRHRELKAAIHWSHQLLERREQLAFRRLSVLSGGFDAAAAAAVCQCRELPRAAVPRVVSALADKSLLVRIDSGEQLRFRQLNTIRAFGFELLLATGELTGTMDRAADWLAELARPMTNTLCVRAPLLGRLRDERDNLVAAVNHAAASAAGAADFDSANRYLLLAVALAGVWQDQDRAAAGRQVLAGALDLAPASVYRGEALATAGTLAARQNDLDEALRLVERAVRFERGAGRPAGLAKAFDALAFTHLCRGEHPLAVRAQRRCIAVVTETGSVLDIALAKHNLAWQLLQTGDEAESERLLAEALPVYRTHNAPPRAHAVGLHTAGVLHLHRGDLETANECFVKGLGQVPSDSMDGTPLVEGLAIIAVRRKEDNRALCLFAAAAAARRRHDVVAAPGWRGEVSQAVEVARTRLDIVRADAAAAAGERMRGYLLRSYALREITRRHPGTGGRAAEERPLSEQDLRIATLVAEGATNREIADRLRLSVGTVTARLTRILATLGLRSRTQLAAWAARGQFAADDVKGVS